MVLLVRAMTPPLMRYAHTLGRELSCYKLTNYLIADHGFAKGIQEGGLDKFIEKLLKDIPRSLCMDKRARASLRVNVRMSSSYYHKLEIRELCLDIA